MNRQEHIHMDRTERVELTTLCLVRNGEKILVENRQRAGSWNGWVMPGGHVEPGESFTESTIRECLEETGITMLNPQLCGIKQFPRDADGIRYIVLFFCTDHFSGECRDSDEGTVAWMTRDELCHSVCVPDFFEMLSVMEGAWSELQYVPGEDGKTLRRF